MTLRINKKTRISKMSRRKASRNKVKRLNGRGRIRVRKSTLNLPDQLWQAYQNSQQSTEKSKELVDTEEKNVVDEEKKPLILKQLSVKLDNYLVFPNIWNALTQKLNEGIELHKNMYQNLINAKQILVSCSVRACIQKTDESNSLTQHITTADTQLEEIVKNMHKQEDALVNCKKIFDKVSVPLQIMNTSFIEDTNYERLSNLLESKTTELQNEKEKHNFLQAELQKSQHQFFRMKNNFKNCMQKQNKLISHLKLKLHNMRKHCIKISRTHKVRKEINVSPMENQIDQLKTLMGLAHSMLGTITENQINAGSITSDKKDILIKDLKEQLQELKSLNKQKDKEIKRLLESVERANKEKLQTEEKNKKIEKEKDLKINELVSSLNALKRKHERWLMDRYFQKCHSIMLFEKIRETEKTQTALLNIKKFECKKDEIKNL